jgi:hypothetical protein
VRGGGKRRRDKRRNEFGKNTELFNNSVFLPNYIPGSPACEIFDVLRRRGKGEGRTERKRRKRRMEKGRRGGKGGRRKEEGEEKEEVEKLATYP